MASEMMINGVTYNVVQINGQKIAEATNYYGPAAPENAEVSPFKVMSKGRLAFQHVPDTATQSSPDLHQQPARALDREGDPADHHGARIRGQAAAHDALLW